MNSQLLNALIALGIATTAVFVSGVSVGVGLMSRRWYKLHRELGELRLSHVQLAGIVGTVVSTMQMVAPTESSPTESHPD